MIDLDLSLPVNQVRVIVGDITGDLISDSNIQFVLDKHSGDVLLASEEVLSYLVNMIAYYVREEAGDVKVYWDQIYERLKLRYDDLIKDNLYKKVTSLFYFGGTTKSEINRVRNSSESVGLGFTEREFYEVADSLGIDLDDPYYLRT